MKHRLVLALIGIACCAMVAHAQNAAQNAGPLAARDIARGVELTAGDIAGDSAAASRIGWVTRRVIREGEALKEPAVAPPQLVRAGTEVTVRAETGGVLVTRTGTALSSGSFGDRVRVRIDAQHIITGTVASAATVKVQ